MLRRRPGGLSSSIARLACVFGLAACGSSSSRASSATASRVAQVIAFAGCMRSHGVPNFPDPTSGGGIHIDPSSGINPFSPSFRTARAACAKLLPGFGGPQRPSEQTRQAMVAESECMRSHGVMGFPDPTLTPPTSTGGDSSVIGRDGVFLAIPNTIDVNSPAFKQAAAVCKLVH